MVIRTIGSVLEATGLPRTDPSASNVVSYNLYLNPIKFLRIYIFVTYVFKPRKSSRMPKQFERRTKHRMDPVGGNQEEGGSSNPVVASTRELRPRGQKRP